MTKARDLANSAAAFAAVSATELGYVDGVTSAIQTQMDAKAPSSTAVTLTGTQTLTNKTLTSPVIASVINNTLTSTTGDIIYASAANTPARLGIGSTSQILSVSGGIPAWSTPAVTVNTVNWVRLTSGTSWSVPATIKTATIWVIAGGGGGGGHHTNGNCGGGAGAGGMQMGTFDLSSVASSTIAYAIGAGGAGGSTGSNGSSGSNTTFGTALQAWYLSANGGGFGQGSGGAGSGSTTGGCGGGTGGSSGGTSSQGAGGGGISSHGTNAISNNQTGFPGGGNQGGSGGQGGNAGSYRGAGGVGIFINNYGVGGGGNGGSQNGYGYWSADNTTFGGGTTGNTSAGGAGTANTGGGGGAGGGTTGTYYSGGAGGSGVIFIQYLSQEK